MAITQEFLDPGIGVSETLDDVAAYDECNWKTFQRQEETQTETGEPSFFIDDIDNLGQQGGVD